ncbi:Ras GTPase-activating-like protein IQGAP3 [Amphibalanus amphitrite]|uniref:Ras GTPase-activating-like protein IQGAP3 n=1 Tax=Amphibalanus amphitrite TaxID=1232801 RepID=A0A6A4WTG3_AMPAM|nr:Ras GTPase-activating-like protein IQGAP3 [Amphibalanus amphitrite]
MVNQQRRHELVKLRRTADSVEKKRALYQERAAYFSQYLNTSEGSFQVNAKLLGVQLEREEISLQELLQRQYGGVSVMDMFGRVRINVNRIIFLRQQQVLRQEQEVRRGAGGPAGLKGGKRGGNRTGTSAAIFSLEAADVGVAYSGQGRDEGRGEEIGALGVGLRCGTDIEPPTALCCWLTWLEVLYRMPELQE